MSRADLLWGAAAALSFCAGPSAVAAELRAIGVAVAAAYRVSDPGSVVQMPGPDSLQVTVAAAAGDGLINPSPPPNNWEMSCIVGGIGIARYGSLAGRAHAEASSRPANTFGLTGGEAQVTPGYTDGVQVLSDTLATGTPVTLTFAMTLEATAVHSTDMPNANPVDTGAGARHEVEVRDPDDFVHFPSKGALVVNSRGAQEGFTTFELDTAIGRRLEIVANLFVAAGVDIDFATQGFTQGSADVVADNTAELFFQPSGDVRLVSDSGHDYAVPEPGRGALLAVSAALVLLRGRKRGGSVESSPAPAPALPRRRRREDRAAAAQGGALRV